MIYLCDYDNCTFLTRWKSDFDTHRKRHSGSTEKTEMCESCGKSFFCKRDLNIHSRTHTGIRPYSCPSCEKKFVQKGHLNSHITKFHHNQAKSHPCPWPRCKRILRTSDGLLIHHNTHTGQKPHSCSVCGRNFVSSSNLKSHSTIHLPASERQHGCDQCGKTFRLKSMLLEHKLSHTSFRPFKCQNCHKGFKRKQQLRAHENTHSGERPFVCQTCKSGFKSSSRLSHHKKKCFLAKPQSPPQVELHAPSLELPESLQREVEEAIGPPLFQEVLCE